MFENLLGYSSEAEFNGVVIKTLRAWIVVDGGADAAAVITCSPLLFVVFTIVVSILGAAAPADSCSLVKNNCRETAAGRANDIDEEIVDCVNDGGERFASDSKLFVSSSAATSIAWLSWALLDFLVAFVAIKDFLFFWDDDPEVEQLEEKHVVVNACIVGTELLVVVSIIIGDVVVASVVWVFPTPGLVGGFERRLGAGLLFKSGELRSCSAYSAKIS